jgi:multidrug resistance efflux pump
MPIESQPPPNSNSSGAGGSNGPQPGSQAESAVRKPGLKRIIRIALGAALLVIAGWLATAWLLTPGLWHITSVQAVVNARIRSLHSTIEGIVTTQPPSVGKAVPAGSLLLTIENSLVDDSHSEELKTEATSLAERVVALKAQKIELENLKGKLTENARNYHEAAIRRLERQVEEAKSMAVAAEALAKQRDYKKDQTTRLAGGQSVSQLEMITASLAREAAKSKAAQATLTVQRLTEELQAVRDGSFTGFVDGRNDVPYSEQRAHEIDILQREITVKVQEHSARHAQIEKQLQIERERLKRQGRFQLRAPIDGVVWRQPVSKGTPITRETELLQLLDASEIFVDALVNGKYFGAIHPGDPVVITFVGSHEEVPGTVKDVLGQVGLGDERSLAAVVPKPAKQEIHVLVSFATDPAAADHFQSYHIGRPVQVRFVESTGLLRRLWDSVSP